MELLWLGEGGRILRIEFQMIAIDNYLITSGAVDIQEPGTGDRSNQAQKPVNQVLISH